MAYKRSRFGHSSQSRSSRSFFLYKHKSRGEDAKRPPQSSATGGLRNRSDDSSSQHLPRLPNNSSRSIPRITSRGHDSSAAGIDVAESLVTLSTDDAESDSDENVDFNETIMAIDLRDHRTIGCAYYVAREQKLYVMEDVKMASMEMIDTLKIHISPTTVLINTKANETLEEYFTPYARRINTAEGESIAAVVVSPFHSLTLSDDVSGSYLLEWRPSSDFKYESSKDRLAALFLPLDVHTHMAFLTPGDATAMAAEADYGDTTGHEGRLMRLAGVINLDAYISVCVVTVLAIMLIVEGRLCWSDIKPALQTSSY